MFHKVEIFSYLPCVSNVYPRSRVIHRIEDGMNMCL